MKKTENRVLEEGARSSTNFFESDRILQHALRNRLSTDAFSHMKDKLSRLGASAAGEMDQLSMQADRNAPSLKRRTPLGEPQTQVEFHPSYWKLVDIAAQSEMFYVKYAPDLRKRFEGYRHRLGFSAGQLYSMSELGVYCPLCMTDGAAHLIDRHATKEDRERLLPRLSARTGKKLYTGAMFLTEKSGGSDVGANLTRAEKVEGEMYHLTGEKWFCSNVNAEVILVLARTGSIKAGIKGLSLFLVENGQGKKGRNSMEIIRLKDKLGVRSMATGEVRFNNTEGKRIGSEGEGFKIMAEMINISRIYNSVSAMAGARRALVEAWQYLSYRVTFGKIATNHALVREKFHELGALHTAGFLLVWRTLDALDAADTGDEQEASLLRMLTPMAKWWTAETGVYMVRESMELMGGNGYIEDFVMPKLLRDINVLPIWEGSGNIIVLDILRAIEKSNGLEVLLQEIISAAESDTERGTALLKEMKAVTTLIDKVRKTGHRDTIEATARPVFGRLIQLYLISLMIRGLDDQSRPWIEPALNYFTANLYDTLSIQQPISVETVEGLMGWEY